MYSLLMMVAVLAAGALHQTAVPQEYILDVVSYPLSPEPVRAYDLKVPAGGARAHDRKEPSGLVLTLVSVDRNNYLSGDAIIYELVLENQGSGMVTLPWSPDRVRFNSPSEDANVHVASLFLEVRNRGGRERLAWLQPQLLFGSADVDGSLQTLAPGERARIRVPGFWRASEYERAHVLRQPNGLVRVAAVVHIEDLGQLVTSVNTLPVAIGSRMQ
jgi:hypothetical protein